MSDKLLTTCCFISFVCGISIAAVVYNVAQHDECTVKFSHGKEVHVMVGKL
jgi:hypothetical protein